MEVNTYVKEQAGKKKERESIWQVLGIAKKLGNFGRAFVNFGEPINLKQHFDQTLPGWRTSDVSDLELKQQVTTIARKVMININAAAAVNALPLCAAVLLANKNRDVDENSFLQQLNWHQQWLSMSDENSLVTYQKNAAETLLQQGLAQNKFQRVDKMINCTDQQALVLNYYRNNIVHLFVLPSLIFHSITRLIEQKHSVEFTTIVDCGEQAYLQLQKKLFLSDDLPFVDVIAVTLDKLLKLDWLQDKSGQLSIVNNELSELMKGHLVLPFDKTCAEN
jgi:glycerol-3-phosphate O-acyltransferase